MFFRSVKCTCKNTVMKESVRNFYLDNFDLMDPASAFIDQLQTSTCPTTSFFTSDFRV